MRIGPLTVRWRNGGLKSVSPATADTDYSEAIAGVAAALAGFDWYVAGGLVAPIMLGRYWRAHSDLDVLVRCEDVPAIGRSLRPLGYCLVLVILIQHRNRQLAVRIRLPATVSLRRLPRARLSFERCADDGRTQSFPRIDVYRYAVEGDLAHIYYGASVVAVEKARLGAPVLLGGTTVPCLNIEHVDRFKADRTGPKHVLDRRVIESLRTDPCGLPGERKLPGG